MNSWEVTKIAAAVLSALLIIFGTKTAIEISQASHGKVIAGYKLPVKEGAPGAIAAAGPSKAITIAEIAPLLTKASVEGGQAVFKKCLACHTPDKGGANRVGPNLWNIVDRSKSAVPGFTYSESAKAKASEKWSYEALVGFLYSPAGYMPGTKMQFAGVKDANELADVIAYLRSLADAPAALPK